MTADTRRRRGRGRGRGVVSDDLLTAAEHAVEALADMMACVHGPAFDSASWGNDCSICEALSPLVAAIRAARAGAPGAGEGE